MTIIRQGEVRMEPVDAVPEHANRKVEPQDGVVIVGESESHHHHVLESDGVTVLEQTKDVPVGMRILYAIVEQPTRLLQTSDQPHQPHVIEPGLYRIRIKREYNPFLEQARQVKD